MVTQNSTISRLTSVGLLVLISGTIQNKLKSHVAAHIRVFHCILKRKGIMVHLNYTLLTQYHTIFEMDKEMKTFTRKTEEILNYMLGGIIWVWLLAISSFPTCILVGWCFLFGCWCYYWSDTYSMSAVVIIFSVICFFVFRWKFSGFETYVLSGLSNQNAWTK